MFHQLVNHNQDLKRLVDKGYAVGFDNGFLIVREIPYLDGEGQVQLGAIVAKLVFVTETQVTQDDHQVFFAGGVPHGLDGKPVPNLADRPGTVELSAENSDIVIQRRFSNKPVPENKYTDFYHKIETYVTHIAGPAMERHGANPYTYNTRETLPNSVFKKHDTLTSRAEILDLAKKFENEVVAVIGLGGTGAYVLDFLVKTPVREIKGYDGDTFHVHTSYRSPGMLREEDLGRPKAEVYRERYEHFRKGLTFESRYVDEESRDLMEGVTFAFVCVDNASSRNTIFDLLIDMGIPFIDVGLGLNRKDGGLKGSLRTTLYSVEHAAELKERELAPTADDPEDEYRTNIQISELNALNAAAAVIRYKQIRGFYLEDKDFYQVVFNIRNFSMIPEWHE